MTYPADFSTPLISTAPSFAPAAIGADEQSAGAILSELGAVDLQGPAAPEAGEGYQASPAPLPCEPTPGLAAQREALEAAERRMRGTPAAA